jgi:lipoate-protein ligase A
MKKATYKVPGGKMVRVAFEEEDDSIIDVTITGDFFIHPESVLVEIEKGLAGIKIETNDILLHISEIVKEYNALLIGLSPEDLVHAIMLAHMSKAQ